MQTIDRQQIETLDGDYDITLTREAGHYWVTTRESGIELYREQAEDLRQARRWFAAEEKLCRKGGSL